MSWQPLSAPSKFGCQTGAAHLAQQVPWPVDIHVSAPLAARSCGLKALILSADDKNVGLAAERDRLQYEQTVLIAEVERLTGVRHEWRKQAVGACRASKALCRLARPRYPPGAHRRVQTSVTL